MRKREKKGFFSKKKKRQEIRARVRVGLKSGKGKVIIFLH
jgi:hypothetical protein